MWPDRKSALNPQAWLLLPRVVYSLGNSCSKLGFETGSESRWGEARKQPLQPQEHVSTVLGAAGARWWDVRPAARGAPEPSAFCIPSERTNLSSKLASRGAGRRMSASHKPSSMLAALPLSQGRAGQWAGPTTTPNPLLFQFVFSLYPVLNREFKPNLPRVVKC